MEGWVKFHRKIEEWEWYTDPNTFRLFFHLVLKANHKPNNWRGIEIGTGELVTSRDKLSEQLHLTVQQVRTSLTKLESTKEITIKTTNKYTLVTIENYTIYQTKEEKVTNKTTNEQPSNNHQITTNKNDKNEKEIYRAFKHLSLSLEEYERMVNDGYRKTDIDDTLDGIENYAKNKSYTNLNLTVRKWFKRAKIEPVPKFEKIIRWDDEIKQEPVEVFEKIIRRDDY